MYIWSLIKVLGAAKQMADLQLGNNHNGAMDSCSLETVVWSYILWDGSEEPWLSAMFDARKHDFTFISVKFGKVRELFVCNDRALMTSDVQGTLGQVEWREFKRPLSLGELRSAHSLCTVT